MRIRLVRQLYIPTEPESPLTRSESASFSRSLRRLEKRGLIKLFNTIWGPQKNYQKNELELTRKGTEIAKPLITKTMRERVNIW